MTHSHAETPLQQALLRFSPFTDLDPSYLHRLQDHAFIVDEPKGKLLFKRGKTHAHRFFLLSGSVDLVAANFDRYGVGASDERAQAALNDLSPSLLSAVTVEPCSLLCVEADMLDLALLWAQSADSVSHLADASASDLELSPTERDDEQDSGQEPIDWMSALIESPLLTRIPPAYIQTLFARFERLPCKKGEVVIHEGASGDYFYVIHQGMARVTNLTGKLNVELSAGHCFGEEALVADTPRNATVTMLTDGALMRLRKADFVALLHDPVQKSLDTERFQEEQEHFQLIDVRLPIEFKGTHVPGCRNIPIAVLRDRLSELSPQLRYAVTDDAGRRAHLAAYLLCQAGLDAYILQDANKLYQTGE